MKTPEQNLATKICLRDGEWGMTGCLKEAKNEVALRGFDDLDNLLMIHVRVLACLCMNVSNTISTISTVVIYTDLDDESANECLETLCKFNYAVWNGNEYQATTVGKNIIR